MSSAYWINPLKSTCLVTLLWTLVRSEAREYCLTETFEATCSESQVIMMTEAKYGRMRNGRCIKRDYGYIGCSENVLHLIDRMCSGRRSCSVSVPAEQLEALRPCPEDLKMYLQADFKCVDVVTASSQYCHSAPFVKVKAWSGYLSSHVTLSTKCGGPAAPWLIEVPMGMRINLTLINFTWEPQPTSQNHDGMCTKYATIQEGQSRQDITVCEHNRKYQQLYVSHTSQLEVHILAAVEENHHFLIQYSVIGCASMSAPDNGWVERIGEEDVMTVGCHHSNSMWTLTCVDNAWTGPVGNCTKDSDSARLGTTDTISKLSRYLSIPQELALVIVIGTALIIALFILAIGVICLKRSQMPLVVADDDDYQHACVGDGPIPLRDMEKHPTPCPHHPHGPLHHHHPHNEYEVIWDAMLQTNTLVPKQQAHQHLSQQQYTPSHTLHSTEQENNDNNKLTDITVLGKQDHL